MALSHTGKVLSSKWAVTTLLLIVHALGYSQTGRLQFQHVTVDKGLSHPAVTEICQDSAGFMWFGSFSGLNRFDGREVRAMDMPTIHALCTDREGNLWIGTAIESEGLHCISASRDTIISYDVIGVRAIAVDEDSTLWVGGANGLFHLDPRTHRITRMGKNALADSGVTAIALDKRGNLWLITRTSILYFDKASQLSRFVSPGSGATQSSVAISPDGTVWIAGGPSVRFYKIDPGTFVMTEVLENGAPVPASTLAVDTSGKVYVGTWGLGLKIYDPQSRSWESYRHSEADPQGPANNLINAVCFDRTGNLWLGTSEGVSWTARWRKGFTRISAHTSDEGMEPGEIRNLVEDSEGNLWLGTIAGLKKWDRKKASVVSVKSSSVSISSLCLVGRTKLWTGIARDNGLMCVDTRRANAGVTQVSPGPRIKERVTAMHCDGDTVMWLGCRRCRIYRYDLRTGLTTAYRYETPEQLFPGRLSFEGDDCPRMICRDRQGILWIATQFGILRLNEKTGVLRRYVHSRDNKLSFWESTWCTYEDTRGRFWVGNDLGLDLFDRSDGSFRPVIHSSRRLMGKTVIGIAEDKTGTLWLQTDGMLLRYNHDTGEQKQYGPKDGFPITDLGTSFLFGNHTCFVTSSGEIALGIRDGIVMFKPDELWDNPGRPTVEITGVSAFGQSLPTGEQSVRTFGLPQQPLRIKADGNSIRFAFAGLDYTRPDQIKYAVWLEPTDHRWSNLGTQNFIQFINLSPGKYRVRVKAANGDSAWSIKEASYGFEVLPPWWQTRWAYFGYAILLFGSMYLTWRMQVKRIWMRHEFQMARFETDKLHEVDELKSRFFTNISHEFRTPLTLILAPVKQIAERIQDGKTKEELEVVHRNASKLLKLVNELLDISKLESGNMKLEATRVELVPLLKALVLSFSSYAERKGIDLKFSSTDDGIIAYIDAEKFERIIVNVLSNAFEFTPEGGSVEVGVSKDERYVNIRVSDTGIGIPKEEIPRIFDRFYQVDGTHTREHEGTGIGLALTKELIELQRGTIGVDSEEGRGTTFTISIPLGKGHLKPDELCESNMDENGITGSAQESVELEQALKEKNNLDLVSDSKRQMVLIIEDNSDVRNYIKGNLEKEYRVVEAVDGEDGWNGALKYMPDMIVSDVMMPKMDGFELCKRLKTDERTSHIPVILLTAKASSQDKVEGFEIGADEYIMKPFEPEELKVRIRNLILQRQRLHEHFRKNGIIELDQLKVAPVDEKFLRMVIGTITENISNASFSVEMLAELSAVSRSVLHRKIVSLTGEPPVELVRRIRLTRAAELIEKEAGNMSQIALEVGFTNPAYFSECFRKQFGVSPSQYASSSPHP